MKLLFPLLGALALTCTAQAQGTFDAITAYSTPSGGTTFVPGTAGWSFTPTVDMTVTDLGALDVILTQGTINIGLWTDDASPTLLGQAAVTTTNAAPTVPEYSSITPVDLKAGVTYRIAAFSSDLSGLGTYIVTPGGTNGSVTMPNIQLVAYYFTTDGTFGFPGGTGTAGQMLLGATFRYNSVPEPSVLALLGLGSVGLMCLRRGRVRS